jgi:ArsR family transcriptional regulator, arsenate/arsenite/antimonite-responsive transcriptional repressor
MDLHRTFRALADPTRLRLLSLLLNEPACVCDLAATLGLPQPLVSRHLAYLRSAGLVHDRRSGTRVNYSVALDGEMGQALGVFLHRAFSASSVGETS